MVRDRAESEAAAGRDELLLNLHAAAHQVHGAVVINPLIDRAVTEDLASSVADAHLSDLGNEAVHALDSAAISGNHLEVYSPHRVVEAGERVFEVHVLPIEGA